MDCRDREDALASAWRDAFVLPQQSLDRSDSKDPDTSTCMLIILNWASSRVTDLDWEEQVAGDQLQGNASPTPLAPLARSRGQKPYVFACRLRGKNC